jgi:hypothetical protein
MLFIAGQHFSLATFHCRPTLFIHCFALQASTLTAFHCSWWFHLILFIAGHHLSLATFIAPGIFIESFSLQASTFHWPLFIYRPALFIDCFSLLLVFSMATFHYRLPKKEISPIMVQLMVQESGHMTNCLNWSMI